MRAIKSKVHTLHIPQSVAKINVGLLVLLILMMLSGFNNNSCSTSSYSSEPKLRIPIAMETAKTDTAAVASSAAASKSRLLTVKEIKDSMRFPCNYVHDGFYLSASSECVNQVYQVLQTLQDDDVPVLVEVGGHDGITKSISLKASICLNVNTLLIEASPYNFNILKKSRAYDYTVNAALCEGESAVIQENPVNSGESKLADVHQAFSIFRIWEGSASKGSTFEISCTTLDDQLDELWSKAAPPGIDKSRLKLVHLILDVEGNEPIAIKGIQRYSPMQVSMETKFLDYKSRRAIDQWAEQHKLKLVNKKGDDSQYNFFTNSFQDNPELFYGARHKVPQNIYKTSLASKAYLFYGQ